MNIKIIAPDIWVKDAVGNFCLDLAVILSENYSVTLYAQNFSGVITPHVKDMDHFFNKVELDDVLILNYSIYDKYIDDIVALKNKKICYYHGVTPPELIEEFEPITAELCRKSRLQLPFLNSFDVLLANSTLIANELNSFFENERDIYVIPPVFSSRYIFNRVKKSINKSNVFIGFLYVGRVVPHKKIEDVILIISELHKHGLNVKLSVVGDNPNINYNNYLNSIVSNLGLKNDDIKFTGLVSDQELYDNYEKSHFYITMSEHEGFGIPVLESLSFGLPVILKSGTAANEIAGELSIVINDLSEINSLKDVIFDVNKINSFKENGPIRAKTILEENTLTKWINIIEENGVKREKI
jgi:glycosyltransferase involved in cell wall biosynthesis